MLEVNVYSQPILDDMNSRKNEIEKFFRRELDNGSVTLRFIMTDTETVSLPYTPKEKFDDMLKRSKALQLLAERLELTPS